MENVIKVLIVEDVAMVAKLNNLTLQKLGCESTVAQTGAEALDQFKKNQFDLILMDLGLPDIDGFNLTKVIRDIEKTDNTHIPIIILTTHSDKEHRESCKQIGIDDFLLKPLTEEKASAILHRYVAH